MLRALGYLCVAMALSPASTVLAEPRTMTLAEATDLAMTSNPDVRALAASIDAARARLAAASLLLQGNPTVTTTAGPRSSSLGESLDYSFQVLQPFEIAGQRAARIDTATSALGATEAQLQALRAEVTARVRESFGRALAAEQRVQLAAEASAVGKQGVDAAEERFRAGAAALLEVNTARVEVGRLARIGGSAARRRAEAFADLHLVIGLDPMDTVTLREETAVFDEPLAAPDQLVREALANRAEIRAGELAHDAAKAGARLASREWIPSPRLGVGYTKEQESDTGILQGILSFDLPLFNRNQAARGEAAARVIQLEIELEAIDRQVRQDVLTALARVEAARAAADGYQSDVVKAMQENLDLSAESYRAGKIDFLQLLVIRRQTLEARGEYIDVLEELNAARAQLDRALGRGR
jgi:cobalt-zinc-cadmium efflux system outer membrane protein